MVCRSALMVWLGSLMVLAPLAWGQSEDDHPTLSLHGTSPLPSSPAWDNPLGPVIQAAAADYGVPTELLITLGRLGSGFENRQGEPTIEGGYGPMALRENALGADSLAIAALLIDADAEEMKVNPVLNIEGAAAILDQYARDANIDRSGGLDAWWPVAERYSGLDEESSVYFAWQVFSMLRDGFELTNSQGEIFAVSPQTIQMDLGPYAPPDVVFAGSGSGQAQGQTAIPIGEQYGCGCATWDPAASCNYEAISTTKDTVVIHTAEGSYSGTISWFKNCNAQVSAHYVVAYDGRRTQCVDEHFKAWHVSCYNSRSLGIEHEGFASASSHPTAQYDASGDLTANMCDRWGIPKQKRTTGPGIIGHVDITNCCCGTHTDPGAGWDWTYYINRVNGGSPPPPAYAANYSAQSYPSSMTSGTTAVVWAEFTNTGTSAWTHCATKLGTSSPQDRTSAFCTPSNWKCADGSNPGCNRPTDVDQSSVANGAVGRFTFILTAPSTATTYVEKFKLVQEGVTWFGPEITWTINVTAAQGNLTGTVRNAANSAVISGASVTLSGVGSTTTNGSGVYSFNNVNTGNYTVSVSASGFTPANANVTINSGATTTQDFSLTVTDTESPSTPTNLVANATGTTTIHLAWTASADNIGVTGYDIRRNGSVVNSSGTNSFNDSGLSPQTMYTYEVRAKDAASIVSGYSNSAAAVTMTAQVTVFSDGFNGNLNNWTQQVGGFAYSTTVNRGGLTGAGAAYVGATETDQMYHTFSRPFAQCKVGGYYWDGKGGWKTSVCGWAYRQSLSLREMNNATSFFIDNCFNSAVGSGNYWYRKLGGGGSSSYVNYATRDPNTDCNGTWVYFETTISPGAVGASPTGTITLKAADRAATNTVNIDLTTDYFSAGVGRITLGLGAASTNEGYWDDITFEATPPNIPALGAPVASATQIQWALSPADNNFFGYDVLNSSGTAVSPAFPNAGWVGRSATSWTESGLTPNTAYTRKVRTWNGTLNSFDSATVTAVTLSPAPGAGSVTSASSTGCPGQGMDWTAVGGFGAGKVDYYLYAWDLTATHTFTGSEPIWNSGILTLVPATTGTWYLHVRGYNSADVANGQYDYALSVPDTDADGTPDCQDGCPNDPAKTAPGVCGCGIADIQQTSIQENGQPHDTVVALGGTATLSVGASGVNLQYQWYNASGSLSNGGKISGATTDTLAISNVDNSDVAQGPYHVVVTGGCGAPVTSNNASIIIGAPPTVVAWRSMRSHSGAGELAIALNASATGNGSGGPSVETRDGGIRKILVDFDSAVTLFEAAAIVVTGQTTSGGSLQSAVDYSASVTASMVDSDTLQIVLPPGALPGDTCYTIDVAGSVRNAGGQALVGDTDCMVRSLVGDVEGNGDVSMADVVAIKQNFVLGTAVASAPKYDLNLNGVLNLGDALFANSRVAGSHQALCP